MVNSLSHGRMALMLHGRVLTRLFTGRFKGLQFVPHRLLATVDLKDTPKKIFDVQEKTQFQLVEAQGWTKVVLSAVQDSSLAHCVSADLQMRGSITPAFKKLCGGFEELKKQERKVGEVAVSERNETSFVYHLVTRQNWWDAATPFSMRSCLLCLKEHCLQNNVEKLAVPRLGTGEDRLDWPIVKGIIKDIFRDTDIIITAYTTR